MKHRPQNAVEKTAAKLKKRPGTAVAKIEPQAMDIATLITRAVLGGQTDIVNRLMDARDRDEKFFARKAFDAAIAAAKAKIPVIAKNREVDFPNKSGGGRTNYKYEDLGEIARTIDPILSEHGLSYRFRATSLPNEPVTCTCIISHKDGYSEENTLSAGRDESGNKNSIQAVGSTLTFLQRYTLKAALGLAAAVDDDAKRAVQDTGVLLTAEQMKSIEALWTELKFTDEDKAKFLKLAHAENLEDMLASKYDKAIGWLHTRKQNMGAAA